MNYDFRVYVLKIAQLCRDCAFIRASVLGRNFGLDERACEQEVTQMAEAGFISLWIWSDADFHERSYDEFDSAEKFWREFRMGEGPVRRIRLLPKGAELLAIPDTGD